MKFFYCLISWGSSREVRQNKDELRAHVYCVNLYSIYLSTATLNFLVSVITDFYNLILTPLQKDEPNQNGESGKN